MMKKLLFSFLLFWNISSLHSQIIILDTVKDINLYKDYILKGEKVINYLTDFDENYNQLKKELNFFNENEDNFVNNLKDGNKLLQKYYIPDKKDVIITKEVMKIGDNNLFVLNLFFTFNRDSIVNPESIQFIFYNSSEKIDRLIINKTINENRLFKKFPDLKK